MTRTLVGLDIGSSGVRAAEFAVGRRKASLRRFASVELPEGAIRGGVVADPEALTAALKELWSRGKFGTKTVAIGVANDGVLVRQMDLEWMPPADFRKGLRYQVADALPVPVDEANLDYHLLEEIEQAGEGQPTVRRVARVMLVAAGREMVDGFVHAVQAAGLRPVRVDLLPFALVRAATPVIVPGAEAAPLEAIVDIGADTVVVVVHQGGRPRFVRTLTGHGGEAITRALMERYDWSWEDAERTKVVLGLPGHTKPVADDAHDLEHEMPDLTDHPAHQTITERVDALVSELRTTLTYFGGSAGGQGSLARILLTGRAAALGGLAEAIEERLRVPVEQLGVLGRVRASRRARLTDEDRMSLAVPAGLCLDVAS